MAIIKPNMNMAKGMYKASRIRNASIMLSLFSSLIFSKDFAIIYKMISTIMKSNPYNACGINELGLFATKVVKYGINENISIKRIFNQMILVLIFST